MVRMKPMRVIAFVPKLKIQIRVQDMASVVSVTLWDREVTKILKNNSNGFHILYARGLIAELEKKFVVVQSVESESQNITNSDVISEKSVTIKESKSIIGDNSTPLSTIKHKLTDVYAIE